MRTASAVRPRRIASRVARSRRGLRRLDAAGRARARWLLWTDGAAHRGSKSGTRRLRRV